MTLNEWKGLVEDEKKDFLLSLYFSNPRIAEIIDSVMAEDEIKILVQKTIEENQPEDYLLKVEEMDFDDGWWRVAVVPDRECVQAFPYADLLTRIQEKIAEKGQKNVLLVPVIVDE